ncbi:hypothetical protein TKK_0000349 [Trichogramma kaykai]
MISLYLKNVSVDTINELDALLAPKQIGKLNRPLSDRGKWKANDWENFTLYYSIPILSEILDIKNFKHWILFVQSIYILLKDEISEAEIDEADEKLHEFVADMEFHRSNRSMTYNVHLMLHLGSSVFNWGPLSTQSTFCFESAKRYILNSIKCAQGVKQQVVRYVSLNHSLRLIEEKILPLVSNTTVRSCQNILAPKIQNMYSMSDILYFGKSTYISSSYQQDHNLSEDAKEYKKIIKDMCLYESYEKFKVRSNNSYAMLKDGTFIRIKSFLVDEKENKEIVLYYKIKVNNEFVHTRSDQAITLVLSDFYTIEDVDILVSSTSSKNISKICVFMIVKNNMYIRPVPNNLHY